MLEGRSLFTKNNNQEKEKVLQRSNRVFILQYSPERSKSKKQKKWDTMEPKKDTLSKYLTRREMLSENEPVEELSSRKSINRLATLMSRNKNAHDDGESGCQKLVKVVSRVLNNQIFSSQSRRLLVDAMEALKKYTMFCSSTNYQLFIQSKHQYLFKEKKPNETPLSPLTRINDYRTIEENPLSKQSSLLTPKKSPLESEVIFRKQENEIRSPISKQSIYRNMDSPNKYFESFKMASKDYIPTAETLRSYPELPSTPVHPNIASSLPIRPLFRTNPQPKSNLNELPLIVFQGVSKEAQFFHLCHQKPDHYCHESTDKTEEIDFEKALLEITPSKTSLKNTQNVINSVKRSKLDFALPTPIVPSQQSRITPQKFKVSINYPSIKVDTSKRNRKNNQEVLNANEIAQRMLFGMIQNETISTPNQVENIAGSSRVKKRVSSLPKITFTYTSRQKLQHLSPSSKCIPSLAEAKEKRQQPLKTVLNAQPQRKIVKQQLQSTFGSTQPAANISHMRNSRLQSPQQAESHTKIVRNNRQPVNSKLFNNRAVPAFVPRVESQYYSGVSQNQQLNIAQPQPHLSRQRIVTQQAFQSKDIEYVGIEQQPRGCCWSKDTRSRSLNDRALLSGLQRGLPF